MKIKHISKIFEGKEVLSITGTSLDGFTITFTDMTKIKFEGNSHEECYLSFETFEQSVNNVDII